MTILLTRQGGIFMHQEQQDYLISEAARAIGCHPNTIKNFERRGLINCPRDYNGYRRIPTSELQRLKEIMSIRRR